MTTNPILNEDTRTLAFGSISDSYANLGTAFANQAWRVIINNDTDELIIFTKDSGSTEWLRLPKTTSVSLDYGDTDALSVGTQVQIKHVTGSAPTEGEVNLSLEYRK